MERTGFNYLLPQGNRIEVKHSRISFDHLVKRIIMVSYSNQINASDKSFEMTKQLLHTCKRSRRGRQSRAGGVLKSSLGFSGKEGREASNWVM